MMNVGIRSSGMGWLMQRPYGRPRPLPSVGLPYRGSGDAVSGFFLVPSQLQLVAIAMSRPHSSAEPADAPDLAAAAAVVRSSGLRLSSARRLVLEALYEADGPLTADELAGEMDVASVYRNLETLEEIGLVRHVHLGHRPGLYVRASVGAREYLLCEECGAVVALEPQELDGVRDLIRAEFGYEAGFSHFPVAGRCCDCLARASDPQ
jgi:Fur family ferric uptake transcriptional regulator